MHFTGRLSLMDGYALVTHKQVMLHRQRMSLRDNLARRLIDFGGVLFLA